MNTKIQASVPMGFLRLQGLLLYPFLLLLPFWRGGNVELFWSVIAVFLSAFTGWKMLKSNGAKICDHFELLLIAAMIIAVQVTAIGLSVLGCSPLPKAGETAIQLTAFNLFPCSVNVASSIFSLSQTSALMMLFGLGVLYGNQRSFFLTIGAFLSVAVFFGTIGLLKLYGVGQALGLGWLISTDDYTRFELGFVNPNTLATYLSIASLVCLFQFMTAWSEWKKERDLSGQKVPRMEVIWAFAILLAVLLLLLIATKSRLGVAAGISGLALFVIGHYFGARSARKLSIAFGLLGVVLLVGGILQYDAFARELGDLSTSIDIRMALYSQSLELSLLAPIFGFGANTFGDVFPMHNHLPATSYEVWDKAHNTYLALLVEQGVVGVFLHLSLFVLIFRKFFYVWTSHGNSVALLGVSMIVVIALHSLGDFSMEIFGFSGTAVFLIGMIYRRCWEFHKEHLQ